MSILRFAKLLVCCLMSSTLTIQAIADELGEPWELRLDRDGVQIYTSEVEGSPYDAVLSRGVVEGIRLSSLAAVIRDAKACHRWADRCAESWVHGTISERESLVYTLNDLPFPIRDRDVLAHVKWQQDSNTLAVSMESEATADLLPVKRGITRLENARTTWDFIPLGNGKIEVRNWAHIDPGSNLPAWITNMLLIDTPFSTLSALIQEAGKERYANAEVSFISEP